MPVIEGNNDKTGMMWRLASRRNRRWPFPAGVLGTSNFQPEMRGSVWQRQPDAGLVLPSIMICDDAGSMATSASYFGKPEGNPDGWSRTF
jgi:hypothetical protein